MAAILNLLFIIVTVKWQAPVTNLPITGYKVYYGNASGTYTQNVDVGNVLQKDIDVTLTNPVYFVVRAYNSFGESPNSNEAIAGKPQAPVNLTVQ